MSTFAVERHRTGRATLRIWLLVVFGLVVVIAANAHLVYVAATSQPGCVGHLRRDDSGPNAGPYRAAQSACTPSAVYTPIEGNGR
jgi:hypothetical protein